MKSEPLNQGCFLAHSLAFSVLHTDAKGVSFSFCFAVLQEKDQVRNRITMIAATEYFEFIGREKLGFKVNILQGQNNFTMMLLNSKVKG